MTKVAFGLAALVGSYFVFAFVAWELNPGYWTESFRMMCALTGVFLMPLFVALSGDKE